MCTTWLYVDTWLRPCVAVFFADTFVIPFSLKGMYDFKTMSAKVVKQHLDPKFNNSVEYHFKIEDYPTLCITSVEPNLTLRPAAAAKELRDEDVCKSTPPAISCSLFAFSFFNDLCFLCLFGSMHANGNQ